MKTELTFDGMDSDHGLTQEDAVARFRAAALLGEACTLKHNGKTTRSRDIPRPDRLTEREALQAEVILTWRLQGVLLQLGIRHEQVESLTEGPPLVEVGDGYTIGPSYAAGEYRRAAERWHVFDPEGDSILENASLSDAILTVWRASQLGPQRRAVLEAIECVTT